MTDPKIYEQTYWSHKGKHPKAQDALAELVPDDGEVKDAEKNPALETFRVASNCYYDLYNNGLCNRWEEFEQVFGFAGPYREVEADEDDDDHRSYSDRDKAWWTQANINRVEDAINKIILAAAKEQGITVPDDSPVDSLLEAAARGELRDQAFDDMLAEQERDAEAQCAKDLGKPFVQLTGEDGNVFSIIGRVSGALKKAGEDGKAKEFTEKAFESKSYNAVLRLATEYCDVA